MYTVYAHAARYLSVHMKQTQWTSVALTYRYRAVSALKKRIASGYESTDDHTILAVLGLTATHSETWFAASATERQEMMLHIRGLRAILRGRGDFKRDAHSPCNFWLLHWYTVHPSCEALEASD